MTAPNWERARLIGADGCLVLEDGSVYFGSIFGAHTEAEGEIVFNTSMAGYQEILTDPSYRGQMVVLTYPQIGNYGVQRQAAESIRPWAAAVVVRDLAAAPNHWLMADTLDHFLVEAGVPGLQRLDTRALTRHLRTYGTMRAVLGTLDGRGGLEEQVRRLVDLARGVTPLSDQNLVAQVSLPDTLASRSDRAVVGGSARFPLRVAVVDCGIKHHIVRSLAARGAQVSVLGWTATWEEIEAIGAQGVVISNGPGDPIRMTGAAQLARDILKRELPLLGICLGHQVLGLAAGGTTSRLKFGHHGGNHPVQDLATGRVYITSHNHEFQVDAASIPESSGLAVSMVNLNDGSVEGLAHRALPAFSVQYHPEGCPGPQDNQYLFERFLDMVERPVAGRDALRGDPVPSSPIGEGGGGGEDSGGHRLMRRTIGSQPTGAMGGER